MLVLRWTGIIFAQVVVLAVFVTKKGALQAPLLLPLIIFTYLFKRYIVQVGSGSVVSVHFVSPSICTVKRIRSFLLVLFVVRVDLWRSRVGACHGRSGCNGHGAVSLE